MPELIACLSTGKGTWGHVSRIMQNEQWTKIFLITNDYGKENFSKDEKTEFIVINVDKGIKELITELRSILKEKIKETEVAVNFVSGTGKEHMALISALLQLGVGIRLIALTKDGVEVI